MLPIVDPLLHYPRIIQYFWWEVWYHILWVCMFNHSVVSDSLHPHGLQHARLPCPLPSPRACSNSYPLSQWCHPTISFSVIPFFSHLQSVPASGSFQMSQFFISGGQSTGASASVLPMSIQDWSPLGLDWLDLLAVQGTLKSLLQHHSSKVSILFCSAFFMVQLSHPYMTTGKTLALTIQTFVIKVITILNSFLILVHHIQLVIILWILHVNYPLNLHCNYCLSLQAIPSHS